MRFNRTRNKRRYGGPNPPGAGTALNALRRSPFMPRAVGSTNSFSAVASSRQAFPMPGDRQPYDLYMKRVNHYTFLWNAFLNTIFTEHNVWESYLARRGLYKRTLCIYNPVHRLVDFYASQVYPGVLSADGSPLHTELGMTQPTAIPLSADTPIPLRKAIAQFWQWSNWQENMSLWITYCAAVGDGPVEIIDDVMRGKVYANVLWPGDVIDVQFDLAGNVIAYTKEYWYTDPDDDEWPPQQHLLTKIVTKKRIATYRDEEPFGFEGMPAEYDNPYGFCPMVWNRHRNYGAQILPGSPAVRDWTKIEELNSQVAQINAYIRKQAVSPQLLAGVGEVMPLPLVVDGKEVDPDDLLLLISENAGSVQNLQGNLALESARGQVRDALAEIEADHPEVVMYHMLRQMSNVSGAAANRLMGDVLGLLRLVTQGYDRRSISLFQMGVAIAGMRLKERAGGWRDPSPAQLLFANFDLESYQKGDMNFAILERDLLKPTELESANADLIQYQSITTGVDAGFPRDYQLHVKGISDDDIQILHRYQENAAVMMNHLMQLSTPPLPTAPMEPPKPIVVPEGSTVHVPPVPELPAPPAPPTIKSDQGPTIVTEKDRKKMKDHAQRGKERPQKGGVPQ